MSFDSLGLSEPLLRAVNEKGYTTPSPVQMQAIPAILKGQDIMAAAQTGTGKTAGFTLPLLQRLMEQGSPARANTVRALVLTPTRELAAQVHESVVTYSKHLPLRANVVFGGVSINPQMKALCRGSDVLVATPGRLMDLYQQNAVRFNQVEILVLDEADRMLDMGFIHDIKKILAMLPSRRQNLLFSATFSGDIRTLAKGLLRNPLEIDVSPRNTTAVTVEQIVYPVDKSRKSALLSHLIRTQQWTQALVFSRTKHGANRLVEYLLDDGIQAMAIHGNKSQGARTRALSEFKEGKVTILVATDIAARGLDIQQLPQVVNFDLPDVPEDYVHRIGRTGRAGATGHAISLVCADEAPQLADIERVIKCKLDRQEVEGFKPQQGVSNSGSPGGRPSNERPAQGRPRQNNNSGRSNSGRNSSDRNNADRSRHPGPSGQTARDSQSPSARPAGANRAATANDGAGNKSGTPRSQAGGQRRPGPRPPSAGTGGNRVQSFGGDRHRKPQ